MTARPRLDGTEAVVALLVAATLLWTVGRVLVAHLGVAGMAVAELALVLAPVVAWCRVRRVSVAGALRFAAPAAGWVRGLCGGLVAGAGIFYLVAAIVEAAQEHVAPLPPALRDARLILPATGPRPLAFDLAVLALVPALCEEALFRGALLGALEAIVGQDRARRIGAVLLAALAFGLFHGVPWKVLPTATLGVVFGVLALRTRSVWPAVAAHVANNVLVVMLVRAGHDEPPSVATPLGAALVVGAVVAVAAGLALAGNGPTGRRPRG